MAGIYRLPTTFWVLAVLEDVLSGKGSGLDEAFAAQARQSSVYDLGSQEAVAIEDWLEAWNDLLGALNLEQRFRVQHALQSADNLVERIEAALNEFYSKYQGPERDAFRARNLSILDSSLYIDNFFASSVKYLGPLRDAPKPLHPLASSADPYNIGLRGENTASVLEQHKDRTIRYIPSSQFKSPSIERGMASSSLNEAVVDWLQYLGIADSVESRDMGKLGHELKVRPPNSLWMHDLTHVGVGVSQVLPILVMCLLAEVDSTLVFEQPELHLHPKVQTLLGDFFLSMALCNKQCIVETHSEYLIDRLRFRIASAEGEALTDIAKTYFVEKYGLSSFFREVKINEYGAIADWPDGFFDQSQRQAEEILRAAAQKRKRTRRKGDA
ncbi:MAG: DUF3696 domain-containing protein [Alphaproteobacteria bacterium]|nr:DUF3696 domain-containing protein [Alphaproteobacteria bacterium]